MFCLYINRVGCFGGEFDGLDVEKCTMEWSTVKNSIRDVRSELESFIVDVSSEFELVRSWCELIDEF